MRQFLINFALHGLERGAYPQSVPKSWRLASFSRAPQTWSAGVSIFLIPLSFAHSPAIWRPKLSSICWSSRFCGRPLTPLKRSPHRWFQPISVRVIITILTL